MKSVAEENEAFANLGYKLHNDHSAEFKEDFVGILTEKTLGFNIFACFIRTAVHRRLTSSCSPTVHINTIRSATRRPPGAGMDYFYEGAFPYMAYAAARRNGRAKTNRG